MDYFKPFIWDTTIRATLTWLFVQVPFLNFPVIKQLVERYVWKFTDKAYETMSKFIDMSQIKLKNVQKENMFIESSLKLKIISQRNGTESEEYKNAYKQAHDDFSQFTRFDVAR